MKVKRKMHDRSFDIIGSVIIVFVAIVCVLPFALMISGSLSSEVVVSSKGFGLLPKGFTLDAYGYIFKSPEKILNGYKMSIIVTVLGTVIGLFITSMTGYVLARKGFMLADKLAFYFYFTTLFSGGLLPYYILLTRYLHFRNTIFGLVMPGMLSVFNIIIMKNFVKSIPHEICESALVDGAGEFQIFSKIYLHMMKPALATIGLFMALGYWNNWSNSMLYTDVEEMYTLQYLLYRTTSGLTAIAQNPELAAEAVVTLPTQTVKLAMTVVSIGPIILVYPFVQKYFVQGMTVGAVKG